MSACPSSAAGAVGTETCATKGVAVCGAAGKRSAPAPPGPMPALVLASSTLALVSPGSPLAGLRVAARSRARRGYLLIAALALTFAMTLIALVIANLGRSAQGFTMIMQGETATHEAAQVAMARVQGALDGEADTSGLISGAPPADGAGLGGRVGEVKLQGTLTTLEASQPDSAEGYPTTRAIAGLPGPRLPAQHAAVVLRGLVDGAPHLAAGQHVALYSRLYPYALLAASGGIDVASVRSVRDPEGTDGQITARMACVYGKTAVTIRGPLNGRAYSAGAVTAASGGIGYPSWPEVVDVPAQLTTQADELASQARSGLDSNLDDLLEQWHGCLHADFSAAQPEGYAAMAARCLTQGGTLVVPAPDPLGGRSATQATHDSPGDTDYDTKGGTLTVGVSLRVGSGNHHTLSFAAVAIDNDLMLDEDAVLHVKGDLKVGGSILLAKRATLVVDGTTTAARLKLTYSAASSGGALISSSLLGRGTIRLTQGMTQGTAIFVPSIPAPRSNPYTSDLNFACLIPNEPAYTIPASCPNPAALAFTARQVQCTVTAGQLAPYLGTVTPGPGMATAVPGALLVSDDRLEMGSGVAAGLLLARNGVQLGCSRLVGAAFAASGSITAPTTDVRFFPYYTHAYGYTAGGARGVGAYLYHRTATGRLP